MNGTNWLMFINKKTLAALNVDVTCVYLLGVGLRHSIISGCVLE